MKVSKHKPLTDEQYNEIFDSVLAQAASGMLTGMCAYCICGS